MKKFPTYDLRMPTNELSIGGNTSPKNIQEFFSNDESRI
jgi:hypothetical protein